MVDPALQALTEDPIRSADRASKLYLPCGRLPPKKASEEELSSRRANTAMRRVLEKEAAERKREELFAYYATTTIPAERVAEHMGIDAASATAGLERHGRAA